MKKTLLTTVAAAALVGFAAMAGAQTMEKSGGGASTTQEKSTTPSQKQGAEQRPEQRQGQTAQTPASKPEQRSGQAEERKEGTTQQKGAQEEQRNGMQQKGAQEEQRNGTQQKGAEEERTNQPKGAQTESPNKSNMSESGKSGTTVNERNAASSPGAHSNVQLSSDQRTKIQTIVGHNRSARVTAHVDFDVSVGVRVPRTVHVVVLPEEIVRIVPQFEGFDYIIVGDNILIIDPNTMEIVDIIPA